MLDDSSNWDNRTTKYFPGIPIWTKYELWIRTSTYTRVSNFEQNIDNFLEIRLIRGSTYTRVYTVIKTSILTASVVIVTTSCDAFGDN